MSPLLMNFTESTVCPLPRHRDQDQTWFPPTWVEPPVSERLPETI